MNNFKFALLDNNMLLVSICDVYGRSSVSQIKKLLSYLNPFNTTNKKAWKDACIIVSFSKKKLSDTQFNLFNNGLLIIKEGLRKTNSKFLINILLLYSRGVGRKQMSEILNEPDWKITNGINEMLKLFPQINCKQVIESINNQTIDADPAQLSLVFE